MRAERIAEQREALRQQLATQRDRLAIAAAEAGQEKARLEHQLASYDRVLGKRP